ncbi:DM13 domain-containing protein [Dyadobacter frigoris]|uniref:DM13 domain-containing protein n=1 Tax=Dyadobacter frigoris TaxID=2576211 RepID=A0A4U6CZM8_9BACT|nr:DM13 domain-containing protein [Dyadobacter frigoris]TKT90340.1 DM13 domain-containing protein [Dyadobacter frigoris]GLU52583.1 hypothetical protein Dfri01_20440 [Dyadobacter frigoris]
MKNLVYVLMFTLIIAACKREENTPVEPIIEKVDSLAVITVTGEFSSTVGESVTGNAKIAMLEGKYSLVLDNFMTSNGPDLHVYLSKEATPKDFIDLGSLKSISGTQVYPISGTPDFSQYKYALIHCQQFNHLFGSAFLGE